MSNSKHTPGLWFLAETSQMTELHVSTQHERKLQTREHAVCWLNQEAAPSKVAARARLIAAAPELLEELRNIVEAHRDGIVGYVNMYIEDFRALIARAEGRDE